MSEYEEEKEAVEGAEELESVAQFTHAVATGTTEGGPEVPGYGIVSGGLKVYDGITELEKGETGAGVDDLVSGAATQYSSAAKIAGAEGAGTALGAIAAGAELGKGAAEIATADGLDSQMMDGISDMISGDLDGAAAFGEVGEAVSISGKVGMAAGNAIAPLVFGDKDEDSTVMTEDGVYHASTGNSAVDWVCGVGKYANGRW